MSCGEIFIARRPKPWRSGSDGCAPIATPWSSREPHRLADGGRIAAVEAAGDVRRADVRHHLGVGAHLPGAVALAHVAVEVDGLSSRCRIPTRCRAAPRASRSLARRGAARAAMSEVAAREVHRAARRELREARHVGRGDLGDARIAAGGLVIGHQRDRRAVRRHLHAAEAGRPGQYLIGLLLRTSAGPARRKPMRFDSGATLPHRVEERALRVGVEARRSAGPRARAPGSARGRAA